MKSFLYFFAALLTADVVFAEEKNYFVQKINTLRDALADCSLELLKLMDNVQDNIDNQTDWKEFARSIIVKTKTENKAFDTQRLRLKIKIAEQTRNPKSKFVEEVCVPSYERCLADFQAQIQVKLPDYLQVQIDEYRTTIESIQNDLTGARRELRRYTSEELKVCDVTGTDKLPDYCEKLEDGKSVTNHAEFIINIVKEQKKIFVGNALREMRKDTSSIPGLYTKYVIEPMNDCLNNNIVPSSQQQP